ncbi:Protein of unknown function DUF847 [uncultured Caudovirales phage]|uniref:TtsA-like Glycoside hydrolase family 108 domain-containing protein n=1 Tax=uncultured Caudovirales phage TaxID=2100421 RepID=A0A6J5SU99_9CAUD|nr:Protein of unknown function DUF847 [uncultured Caudovirales phage]
MAKFEPAHILTSRNEGGYTDVRDDAGNWTGGKVGVGDLIGTNKGISAPVLCAFLGRKATVTDMKNLSDAVASAIYKKNYWDVIRGDELLHQEEANSIYDSAVNMGSSRAIILAQRSLGITETGHMDDLTLAKLNLKAA